MLSDGAVAFVRGRDYRIDYLNEDPAVFPGYVTHASFYDPFGDRLQMCSPARMTGGPSPRDKETEMSVEPQQEHRWLERFVGEWTYESEAEAAPGEPPVKDTGTESVRSVGGVWVVCEGRGETPDGGAQTTLMTLGYDPAKQRCVGTFVGSMMPQLWIYEGELDPESGVLTLDTEGPSYTTPGETARYRDRIELRSDDHRVMTSSYLGGDGEWHPFMTSHYRRTK